MGAAIPKVLETVSSSSLSNNLSYIIPPEGEFPRFTTTGRADTSIVFWGHSPRMSLEKARNMQVERWRRNSFLCRKWTQPPSIKRKNNKEINVIKIVQPPQTKIWVSQWLQECRGGLDGGLDSKKSLRPKLPRIHILGFPPKLIHKIHCYIFPTLDRTEPAKSRN